MTEMQMTPMTRSVNYVERFREAVAEGRPVVGTEITLTDPLASEAAAEAGSDFLWIETEHAHLDLPSVLAHLLAARAAQVPALVRVGWNDAVLIKRVIDLAPAGIVVPMVCTADEAAAAVRAFRYPPEGVRGWGPVRNMMYFDSAGDYVAAAGDQVLCILQIEHVEAVRNLDGILATPGIHGIVLGPGDLSASVGKHGNRNDPEVAAMIDTVIAKASASGLLVGTSIGFDPGTVRDWFAKGVQWFALGDTTSHISEGAAAVMQGVRDLGLSRQADAL